MGSALIAPIVGGVVSSALGGSSSSNTGQAASAADPFASQRSQYQSMLQQMMTGGATAGTPGTPAVPATQGHWGTVQVGPSDQLTTVESWIPGTPGSAATAGAPATAGGFTPQDPSYQFRYQQGLDAANAGSAASGMLNSGNRLLALQSYGQGQASTEYANQFARLAQLAGANVGSPAAAGQIIQQGNLQNQQAASAVGNAVGKAVTGWGNQLATGGASTTGSLDLGSGVNIQSDTNTYNPGW